MGRQQQLPLSPARPDGERRAGVLHDTDRILAELPRDGSEILEDLAVGRSRLPWYRAGAALAALASGQQPLIIVRRDAHGRAWARRNL